jgi:hypothetical protein
MRIIGAETENPFLLVGEFVHSESGEILLGVQRLRPPFTPILVEAPALQDDWPEAKTFVPTVEVGIHRHFKKGREYRVFGEYLRLKTDEMHVAYMALYAPYAIMVRPSRMWHEQIDRPEERYRGPRFAFVRPL